MKGVTPDIVLPDRLEYVKFREKDNKSSLPWDEIEKADYLPWNSSVNESTLVNTVNEEVAKASVFSKIKSSVQWLEANNDKPYSLNITKYREEQKQFKDVFKQMEEMSKLTKEMSIKNSTADAEVLAADKDKAEKNKQWLKRLSGDIYINETVKAMNNMIMQIATAKK